MTNEEMQKAMQFIVEMNRQTDIKLACLSRRVARLSRSVGGKLGLTRADERWKETEKGIQALLARAKLRERKIAASGQLRLNRKSQSLYATPL